MTANFLKKIMAEKGITQQELADLAGVAQVTISTVARGKRRLSLQHCQKIAPRLNMEPLELYFKIGNLDNMNGEVTEFQSEVLVGLVRDIVSLEDFDNEDKYYMIVKFAELLQEVTKKKTMDPLHPDYFVTMLSQNSQKMKRKKKPAGKEGGDQ